MLVDHLGLENADICLHGAPDRETDNKALFFYHVHKTGGMSVTNCLRLGFRLLAVQQNPDRIDEAIAIVNSRIQRFDTRDVNAEPPVPPLTPDGNVFVSSHFKFGHHELLDQEFALFTILRDPIQRVIADYHYRVWRKADGFEELSEDDFLRFFRSHENRCMHCQHLSRLDINKHDVDAVFDDAMQNLRSLDGYGTTDQWEDFMQSVWASWNFPNYIGTRWLKTPKLERLDTEKFMEELTEINAGDIALYEYAKQNPKALCTPANENEFINSVFLAVDRGEENSLSGDFGLMQFSDFLEVVNQGNKNLGNLVELGKEQLESLIGKNSA